MNKKLIFLLIIILLLTNISFADELTKDDICSEAGILIDELTGEILYSKNMDKKLYPASTTKILTAIIILENHKLDEIVSIPKDAEYAEGKKVYLLEGERLSIEQLLNVMLIESANDAAIALAVYHSGNEENFAKLMNQRAKELGAKNSNFKNASGLHDDEHYTTAYDLSLFAKKAMKNEIFREIVKKKKYSVPATEKQDARPYIRNTNKFLGAKKNYKMDYKGKTIPIKWDIIDGVKTGYTPEAGNCLVSTAKKNNQRLISITLKASNVSNGIYIDARTLLEYGFNNYIRHTFITEGSFIKTVKLKNADNITLNLIAGNTVIKSLLNTVDINNIKEEILIDTDISAPIEKNQKLGKISYTYDDIEIASADIISEYSVSSEGLIVDDNFNYQKKKESKFTFKFFLNLILRLFIAFVIYRTIMITIYKRKRKKIRREREKQRRKAELEKKNTIKRIK